MTCPVVVAISEIRGGGYIDEDPDRIIKMGGCEYVNDSASFYISERKIAIARFKLSKPTLEQCQAAAQKFFAGIAGKNYNHLYKMLIDKLTEQKYLYKQFIEVVNLLGDLEKSVIYKISTLGGAPINVTIPSISLLPQVDQLIIYRPDILHATTNKIIDYLNELNINSLALVQKPKLAHLDPMQMEKLDGIISMPTGSTAEEYMANIESTLAQEMTVANYVSRIEAYHCAAINRLNEIIEICQKIINVL